MVTFTEASVDYFILEKTLRREFKEHFSTSIIVHYPKEIRTHNLSLGNKTSEVKAAVFLSPFADPHRALHQDKGKSPILNHPPNPTDNMNFIIWNTRSTNNDSFKRQCNSLLKTHNPAVVVLLETKIVDHKNLVESFRFNAHLELSAKGRKGGIVIIWKEDMVKMQNFSISPQEIHTMVKATSNPSPWLFSAIYASPDPILV